MKLNKSIIVLVTLWLLAYTGACFSGENNNHISGKELQSLCSGYQEPKIEGRLPKESVTSHIRCAHYMKGVVETSEFYERMMYTVSGNHIFCFPRKKISTNQAILLSNDYIKRHPEKLDSRGVILVMEAFLETYSCKK